MDLLLESWRELRARLTRNPHPLWKPADLVLAANMLGIREQEAGDSTIGLHSQAVFGDWFHFRHVVSGLDDKGIKAWSRGRSSR